MSFDTQARQREFISYKEHVKQRKYLFEEILYDEVEETFSKLYLLTQVFEDFITMNERDNKTNKYLAEAKADLIVAFDLINLKYLKVANQLSRSAIEMSFRFLLSLTRSKEYERNKENGIYHATQSLTDLRSHIDTHKIGKMTHYVKERFKSTPIGDCISLLFNQYSNFSKYVHINEDTFTKEAFLTDFNDGDKESSGEFLKKYSNMMDYILIILNYLYELYGLTSESALSKRKWYEIENALTPDNQTILRDLLNQLK